MIRRPLRKSCWIQRLWCTWLQAIVVEKDILKELNLCFKTHLFQVQVIASVVSYVTGESETNVFNQRVTGFKLIMEFSSAHLSVTSFPYPVCSKSWRYFVPFVLPLLAKQHEGISCEQWIRFLIEHICEIVFGEMLEVLDQYILDHLSVGYENLRFVHIENSHQQTLFFRRPVVQNAMISRLKL